jgi:hypothetical protein
MRCAGLPFFVLIPLFCLITLAGCDEFAAEQAFLEFAEAAQDGDWLAAYNRLSEESAVRIDTLVAVVIRQNASYAHLEEAASDERFASVVDNVEHIFRMFDFSAYELIDSKTEGQRCTITLRSTRGAGRDVVLMRMLREGGAWKVAL